MNEFDPFFVGLTPAEHESLTGERCDPAEDDDCGDPDWWRDA